MEKPIIGRIEQLTFFANPNSGIKKSPDNSELKQSNFLERQININSNLIKGLVELEERVEQSEQIIDENFRKLSAVIGVIQSILVNSGVVSAEQFDEILSKIVNQRGESDRD